MAMTFRWIAGKPWRPTGRVERRTRGHRRVWYSTSMSPGRRLLLVAVAASPSEKGF